MLSKHKLLGNLKEGRLFVISAPAGTGKSTLVGMLLSKFSDALAMSCSSTTREPRLNEVNHRDYEFISKKEFETRIERGDFLEHANVFGYYYGTRKERVLELQKSGKHVILVIDTQGALSIKGKLDATFIFISPPSLEELERRLFKRRSESREKIQERLSWAQEEIKKAKNYDYHIVNDDLETTYRILESILIAEEHKQRG